MAQYKVPQDVEADDKLLGPFTFRQFVYLLVVGAFTIAAIVLYQIFPILSIIPIPPILFLLILALPIKKDQPMETYLAAIISFYLKPRTRLWHPGQRESTIKITAPKIIEENRAREISGEEATHRLSFLANIVDSGGYAIKNNTAIREDFVAEASGVNDIFETHHFDSLSQVIAKDESAYHDEVVKGMREAIAKNNFSDLTHQPIISRGTTISSAPPAPTPISVPSPSPSSSQIPTPALSSMPSLIATSSPSTTPPFNIYKDRPLSSSKSLYGSAVVVKPGPQPVSDRPNLQKTTITNPPKPSIIELANNPDYTVATIAKEANRIKGKESGEVFISLH